ncbi:hypothetical protein ACIRJS_32950 [Streptomyces sp. NPDC102340]
MYGSTVGGLGGSLASTGFSTFATVIGAATLITAGLAVKKLLHRRRSR